MHRDYNVVKCFVNILLFTVHIFSCVFIIFYLYYNEVLARENERCIIFKSLSTRLVCFVQLLMTLHEEFRVR